MADLEIEGIPSILCSSQKRAQRKSLLDTPLLSILNELSISLFSMLKIQSSLTSKSIAGRNINSE